MEETRTRAEKEKGRNEEGRTKLYCMLKKDEK